MTLVKTSACGAGLEARTEGHSATLLADGRVLVAGGEAAPLAPAQFLSSAELYDPVTGSFSATGSLAGASYQHFAVLLGNGKVLLAAGGGLDRAQLFDLATGAFTPTGSMSHVRAAPAVTRLADGSVLVVGGYGPPYGDFQATAEIYDTATGTFRSAGGTLGCHSNATMLDNGRVLLTGSLSSFCEGLLAGIRLDAEIYDPTTGTSGFTADMVVQRGRWHTATRLGGGSVLILGGNFPSLDLPPVPGEVFRY